MPVGRSGFKVKRTLTGGPTTLYTDDFNRANGAIGGSWTAGFSISSNQAQGDGGFARYTGSLGTTDHWVQADITMNSEFYVLNARGSTSLAQNLYMGFIDPSGVATIGMNVGGGYSTVATGTTGLSTATYTARLEVQGTAIRFYRNGVLVASATDSTHTTGMYVGFNTSGTTGRYDNFSAGTL